MKYWAKFLVPVLAVTAGAAFAADMKAGEEKSAVCMACHGPQGNSLNPVWPKLAGQHAQYIEAQLASFKSGARQDPMMSPQAAALSDADVQNLAAYFAAQTQSEGVARDKGLVVKGERMFRGGNAATGVPACSGCHGPRGMGNPLASFPRISGQHADYVIKALKDFRAGNRSNDMNGMMRGVAQAMTDDEITAVAEFVQGLH
jgi:cytochrome c553